MQVVDLTKILKKEHEGKWIVYSPSSLEIFSFDEDPQKAIENAKNVRATDKSLLRVLPFDQNLAPFS